MLPRSLRVLSVCLWAGASLLCTAVQAQSPGNDSAVFPTDCDYACLTGHVTAYMTALAQRDAKRLPVARKLRFTENNVEMPFGTEGLWATVTGVAPQGLIAADTQTGEAVWIGTAEENGAPVYLGVRLAVREGRLAEVETIVVRNTGLPLPFGDVKNVLHDPAFAQVLPPAERRSRERLRAVADSYFNTVELNDGMVFAPFADDCARLENGILTTAAAPGSAGAIMAGCEAQFRLGIYRINKRVRERRYPLIDVERGVVVATGFFDHANEFDTYKTTDGIERKTALKWPNSISLIEAFRIRDGRIQRVETVFSYVPYFMHSPFYDYPPTDVRPPVVVSKPAACDNTCLNQMAGQFMDAMAKGQAASLPWAGRVRFTENGVAQQIGEGVWGSIRAHSSQALLVADAGSGTVIWQGLISDHDLPAWFALRLRIVERRITEVETFIARARNPGPFGDTAQFAVDSVFEQALPLAERSRRAQLVALVGRYADSVQRNDGRVFARFSADCVRRENGFNVTQGEGGSATIVKAAATLAQGCEAQLRLGLYRPVDRVRDRRVLAVDEARGLVVVSSFADFGLAQTQYRTTDGVLRETQDKHPSTREQLEIFQVRSGRIQRIEVVSVYQPYRMPLAW